MINLFYILMPILAKGNINYVYNFKALTLLQEK